MRLFQYFSHFCIIHYFDSALQGSTGGSDSEDGGGGSNILSLLSTILGGSSGVSNLCHSKN